MGIERNLWKKLREGMAPYWFAQRIETGTAPGVPDVWFVIKDDYTYDNLLRSCAGWLELKALAAWPKRAETVVLLPGLRPEQKAWIERAGRLTDLVYLLLQVGTGRSADILLYDWRTVSVLGTLTKAEMLDWATAKWLHRRIVYADLARFLYHSRDAIID